MRTGRLLVGTQGPAGAQAGKEQRMFDALAPLHEGMGWLISYRLTDEALEVVGCGGQVPLRRFPYGTIRGAWRGMPPFNEHYHNRVDVWATGITVELDRPILPHLSLTPSDPDAFVAELNEKLAQHKAKAAGNA